MLVECTYGPVSTEVMGTTYTFAADEHGRNVAEVWNPKHIRALISVVHYRVVSRDPDSEEQPLALTDISPGGATIGGVDLVMVCTGYGFTPNSVIVFNGGDEVTEFINDVQVSTIVKPSLATTPGFYPVFVRNGEEESEQLHFEFVGDAVESEAMQESVRTEAMTRSLEDEFGSQDEPVDEEMRSLEDDFDPQGEPQDEAISVTNISGIGPSTEAKLAEVGITDARQIAALSDEEAAALDAELGLGGRIARDSWVNQAKALTA